MIGSKEELVLWLMQQPEGKTYEVSEHVEKKSLSQNGYYRKLCGLVAKASGVPSAQIHNKNLRDLGLLEYVGGHMVPTQLPDTDEGEMFALNSETFHAKPTSKVLEAPNGQMWRVYLMLRGSHTFDRKEMSALINLMIQEAEAYDIETLTPKQLEELRHHE